MCQNCADKGQSYFCDVTDKNCTNVTEFRDRVLNSDLKNIKCTVKILQNDKQCRMEDNIVWPYFSGSSSYNYKMWMVKTFPFWQQQINQAFRQKNGILTTYQNGKYWKFLISGKDPAFLELVDILKQINGLCQKYKLEK